MQVFVACEPGLPFEDSWETCTRWGSWEMTNCSIHVIIFYFEKYGSEEKVSGATQ